MLISRDWADFPSTAEEYLESALNLQGHLMRNHDSRIRTACLYRNYEFIVLVPLKNRKRAGFSDRDCIDWQDALRYSTRQHILCSIFSAYTVKGNVSWS
jgi:hypothetical protein